MTPDQVCAAHTTPADVELRIAAGSPESSETPLLLVSGTREALVLLSELLIAVAEGDDQPASFQISPNGAGQFHLSAESDAGLCIQCVPES